MKAALLAGQSDSQGANLTGASQGLLSHFAEAKPQADSSSNVFGSFHKKFEAQLQEVPDEIQSGLASGENGSSGLAYAMIRNLLSEPSILSATEDSGETLIREFLVASEQDAGATEVESSQKLPETVASESVDSRFLWQRQSSNVSKGAMASGVLTAAFQQIPDEEIENSVPVEAKEQACSISARRARPSLDDEDAGTTDAAQNTEANSQFNPLAIAIASQVSPAEIRSMRVDPNQSAAKAEMDILAASREDRKAIQAALPASLPQKQIAVDNESARTLQNSDNQVNLAEKENQKDTSRLSGLDHAKADWRSLTSIPLRLEEEQVQSESGASGDSRQDSLSVDFSKWHTDKTEILSSLSAKLESAEQVTQKVLTESYALSVDTPTTEKIGTGKRFPKPLEVHPYTASGNQDLNQYHAPESAFDAAQTGFAAEHENKLPVPITRSSQALSPIATVESVRMQTPLAEDSQGRVAHIEETVSSDRPNANLASAGLLISNEPASSRELSLPLSAVVPSQGRMSNPSNNAETNERAKSSQLHAESVTSSVDLELKPSKGAAHLADSELERKSAGLQKRQWGDQENTQGEMTVLRAAESTNLSPASPDTSSHLRARLSQSSGEEPVSRFNALEMLDQSASPSRAGLTAHSTHRAEGGYKDPELGWVGIRAEYGAGGIHATVLSDSEVASRVLGTHLYGLDQHLREQQTPVQALSIQSPDGQRFSGFNENGGSHQGYQNPSESGRDSQPEIFHAHRQPLAAGTIEDSAPVYLPAAAGRISVVA